MNLIEATKKAILNGMQENKNLKNEEVNDKVLDVNRIKNWAEKSVKWLVEQDEGCCEYKLDNDLSIFCGWSDGYDPADDGIKPKEDLTFRINIGIKGNHEYMKTDYDWLVAPYDDKTGDVWDTDITVSPEGVSDDDIQWLINQYKEIRQALDDNDIMLEHYEDEDGIYVDDRYPEEIQEQYRTYAIEELSNGEEPNNFDDWIKIEYPDVFNEIEYGLDENKKQEARSHKEDNEKAVPRTSIEKEYMHNNANFGIYNDKDAKKFNQDSYKEPVNAKRNKIRNYEDAKTITHTSYEKSPNKQTQLYKDLKDLGYIKSSKKVTEATTDLDDMYDEYKEAYHKDLDIKTVPCVIARDKMLSGWGRAKNTTHYQMVLCADDIEANNIASNMKIKAKSDGLANIRVDFGIKIPRNGSVSYSVGRNARAWNMSDSWYKRYDRPAEKKEEARSHKEDNEKVAPRTTTRNGKEVKITDIQKDLDNTFVGKRYAKGAVANNPYYGGQYYGTTDAEYRSKRNKTGQKRTSNIDMSKKYDIYKADTFETPVTDYQFAMDRYKSYEKTGNEDMPIAQSYKKSAQDIVNKERERIANKSTENKKITEATLDLDDMYDEYKKAYNKDLDTKRVPCVIARDVMLSGWGGAEGKNHYQVVLCADTVEARNIEYNMRAKAKQEQLANVRTSIGIQLPRNASVAYTVGRYAPAWNMGDSWYESRFGTDENKVEEAKNDVEVKCINTYFEDDEEYWSEGNYYPAKKLSDTEWKVRTNLGTWGRIGDAYTINDINEYFEVQDKVEEAKDDTKIAEIEKQIKSKLKSYKQLKKINKGDTNKSKDLEDEIEDLEAQLKSLKSEAIETQDIQAHTTAGDTDEERAYYGKNLTKRNKIRSLDQAKRNLDRANNGDERVQAKQVYDQVSYDNLPDADLQTYKFRKDMASIHSGEGPKYNKDLTVDGKSKLEPSEHNDMVATMWDIQANNVADKIRAKHIKKEARNPENDKVNAMIRTTLNGSTKYVKDLEDLGFVLDKYGPNGKVSTIHHKDNDEYLYRGKMMGLDKNADLYNYLTKKRPTDWDDRTNSGFEVQKNMSSEKDLADGGYSSNGFTSTVGKSIPKRFKTNKSSIVVTEPYGSKKVKQYKELNKNIAYKKDDIADLQNDVTSMQNDIAKKQNDINSTQDEINQMEKDKKALLTKQKA